MIVDLHTHLWESPEQLGQGAAQRVLRAANQPWDRPDGSPSAHDAAMEPVNFAVILGFESRLLGASITPEQVARYVARKPGKYLGFAGIDPMNHRGNSVAGKVEAAQAMGLVGVTISPAAQGFHPSHSLAWPLYEACAGLGLPLLVHGMTHLSSEAKMEFAQPYLLDEVARSFPKLKIIISQVGHPWVEETLVLMGKHRNVFADLSNVVTRPWQLYTLLQSAHQQGVIDRLLFGSDFPFCTPQKAITTIYSVNTLTQGTMLPSVPREQLRSIVERDVLEVLGLRKKTVAGETKGREQPVKIAEAVKVAEAGKVAEPMVAGSRNGSHAGTASPVAGVEIAGPAVVPAAAVAAAAPLPVAPTAPPAPVMNDHADANHDAIESKTNPPATVAGGQPGLQEDEEVDPASAMDQEDAATSDDPPGADERSTVIDAYELDEPDADDAPPQAKGAATGNSAAPAEDVADRDDAGKPQR